jgi:hypothetical protein
MSLILYCIMKCILVTERHRLNMELDLQSLFGLHTLAETPQSPPPRIWAHIRGHYWSAKIDDISL